MGGRSFDRDGMGLFVIIGLSRGVGQRLRMFLNLSNLILFFYCACLFFFLLAFSP